MRLRVIGSVAVTRSATGRRYVRPTIRVELMTRTRGARATQTPIRSQWLLWTWWPASGSLIATTSAAAEEQSAADRAPAGVVHELEQEEVREQQHEQRRVAVEDPDDLRRHVAGRYC
jgi:hypothetical protein